MTARRGVVRQSRVEPASRPVVEPDGVRVLDGARVLEVPERYDFVGTLAPLANNGLDPCAKVGAQQAWWAVRTPDGPATLHLRVVQTSKADLCSARVAIATSALHKPTVAQPTARLVASAYGPGAEWVLDRADAVAGLRDDVSGFAELAAQHDVVRAAWRSRPGLRMTATGSIFRHLPQIIATQKVTGLEASRAYLGIVRHFGKPAPGPCSGLLLPPDPADIAAAPYWAYHRFGLEQRRAETLRRAAAMADRLDRAPDSATAAQLLRSIPGIGEWTVAEVVRVAFGDPDAVTVGDYHLPNHVVYALTGEARAGARDGAPGRISSADARMLEVLEPFRPQRARVVQVLLASGASAPRFGPRSPARSFARF